MELNITFRNDISEISRLEGFIEQVAEQFSLPMDIVFNLNLVLEEAVANVIMYAYPKEEHEFIYLSASLKDDNTLVFILTDSGKEFDPTLEPDADIDLSAEKRRIGGLGIFLIRQIMNEVRYERIDNKNILTLEKKL